ncbi:MAG: hypothetical protein ACRDN9_09695 [Streptosporangiaceae bacterium]
MYTGIAPLLTVVLAAGLGVAAGHGIRVFAVSVLVVQFGVVFGWWSTASTPGWRGAASLTVALAVGIDAALILAGGDLWVPVAVGLALTVVAGVAHQLLRRDGRAAVTQSLSATVAGAVLVVLGAAWLVTWDGHLGAGVVEAAVAGVGATALLAALAAPLRPPATALVASAIMAAAIAGAAVSATAGALESTGGLALGAAGGLCAAGGHAAAGHTTTVGYGRLVFAGGLPLVAAAPAVYLVGRILAG